MNTILSASSGERVIARVTKGPMSDPAPSSPGTPFDRLELYRKPRDDNDPGERFVIDVVSAAGGPHAHNYLLKNWRASRPRCRPWHAKRYATRCLTVATNEAGLRGSFCWWHRPQRLSRILLCPGAGDKGKRDPRQHLNVEDFFHTRLKLQHCDRVPGP